MDNVSGTTLAPHTTPDPYHVHGLDILYGLISLICGLLGFFGNLVILKTFIKHHKSLSAKIFLAIACNDTISALFGAIPFSIPRLQDSTAGLLGVPVICNMCGPLLNISERYSVFLIAALSVTRAWALKYPLIRIKQQGVLIVMWTYLSIQVVLACIPFVKGKVYQYDDVYTVCTWTIVEILDFTTQYHLHQLLYYLLLFIPFFVPSIFVVVSCVFCIRSIRNSLNMTTSLTRRGKDTKKARASVTIIIFTSAYIILHVPLWIFLVIFLIDNHGHISEHFWGPTPFYLFMFASKVSVFINAALNPFIYIGRVSAMKDAFRDDISKYKRGFSSLKKSITKGRLTGPSPSPELGSRRRAVIRRGTTANCAAEPRKQFSRQQGPLTRTETNWALIRRGTTRL